VEVEKMAESLVVKAKIKDYCKGMNVSGDLADALSKKVAALLSDAVVRAKSNGRKTVQAKDV
jgi:histone H3/H4